MSFIGRFAEGLKFGKNTTTNPQNDLDSRIAQTQAYIATVEAGQKMDPILADANALREARNNLARLQQKKTNSSSIVQKNG